MFADDNFNFDENGSKFSKQEENTVRKGEIARYVQFLLFPLCFQRLVLQTRKNHGLFGKGLRVKGKSTSSKQVFSPNHPKTILSTRQRLTVHHTILTVQ